MENPSLTSQRVRPILRAMERSIEEARRKRGGDTTTPGSSNPNASGMMSNEHRTNSAPISTPNQSMAIRPSSPQSASVNNQPTTTHPAPSPQNSPHAFSSYAQPNHLHAVEGDGVQPARLKARPKRWQASA